MTHDPSPLAVVQAQLDAYNAKDIEALLATYAPDAPIKIAWEPDPFSVSFESIENETNELVASALSLDVIFTSNNRCSGEVVLPPRCGQQSRSQLVLFAVGQERRTLPKQYIAYVAVRLNLMREASRVNFELENVILL